MTRVIQHQTNEMHNIINQYLTSDASYMFQTLWVHSQYAVWYVVHGCEQSGGQESVFETHSPVHQTAPTNASKMKHTTYITVFLRRNPRCSKHVEDIRN